MNRRKLGTVRTRERDAHAWLQDAVSLCHTSLSRVIHSAIERMHHGANEQMRRIAREHRIRIERDDVARSLQRCGIAEDGRERLLSAGLTAQQAIELRELPA